MKTNNIYIHVGSNLGFQICNAQNFTYIGGLTKTSYKIVLNKSSVENKEGIAKLNFNKSRCQNTVKDRRTNASFFNSTFHTNLNQEKEAYQIIFLKVDGISFPYRVTKTFTTNFLFDILFTEKSIFKNHFFISQNFKIENYSFRQQSPNINQHYSFNKSYHSMA